VYSPSLRPATALRVRSARPPTRPMCRVPRHVRYTCQSASTYNICTAQSAVSTVRAFLYRVLAYAYPLLIRSLLGCWRSSCSPALKGRTTGRGPKTGLDSMYDAHVVASSFSSLPATHRLVFYLILDMVDTTQAHSHVRGAPLEQQRIGITGTGRQRVAHGAARMVRPHAVADPG